MDTHTAPASPPSVHDLHRAFARIGLLSFGGPAAQIALMHRCLVDEKRWLTEAEFLRALSFCMVLPGPEAMQLATYAGWRLRGVAGGLIGGLWFVGPGALVILALGLLYGGLGNSPLAQGALGGLKACVMVIVVQALASMARRALHGLAAYALAAMAFVALFVFGLPFPLVVLVAGAWGWLSAPKQQSPERYAISTGALGAALRRAAPWAALWALPLVALAISGSTFLVQLGLFLSKLAALSFGGAYALLAWMAQAMVADHGWLTTPEVIDALGFAETTPGPLILVTAFAALIAGLKTGIGTGIAAWALTLWVTFIPCFLWIFTGAPLIEALIHRPRLSAALQAITASVTGVIASLSLWFALHVVFATLTPGPFALSLPSLPSARPEALALAALAALLIRFVRAPLWLVLGVVSAAGVVLCALL